MKKAIIAIMGASMLLAGCSASEVPEKKIQAPAVEAKTYIMSGRYYTSGELFTEDGNAWEFSQDVISEEPAYDNEPVFALFNDMGTANKYDDEILGLVLDVETAIYDELEVALSKEFSVERNENALHLDPK